MSQDVNATEKGRCWKQHICVGCQAVFRYIIEMTCSATGDSEEEAQKRAKENLQIYLSRCIDILPCPHCGIYQPEMLEPRQPLGCVLLTISFITLVALLIIGSQTHVPDSLV